MGGGVAWQGDDLILDVHVQPRASKSEVAGMFGERLKIRVAAPPVDGKANQALIDFLAKAFNVARRDILLLAGEGGRDKRFKVLSPKRLPDFVSDPKKID
jgi:uncharacterized protein (TIGR00251 family)